MTSHADKIVLVTGINGYIGSHIGNQFLVAGFKVRGTVRTIERGANVKRCLEEKHGKGRVEIVEVKDITVEGAFDEAVKGVYAVAHSASIMSFDKDPSKVIPGTVAAVNSILNSSLKEPSVKNFIFTSSSTAATAPKPNLLFQVDADTWNDEDIAKAWVPESQWGPGHEWIVYGASKTEAEKALWKFRDEKKPGFTINAVLPATNFGPVISKEDASSTGAMIREVYEGRLSNLLGVAPQYFVSVEDTARLHVAPVLFPDVENQRLFAWAAPYNWNDILRVLRELRPTKKFPDDVPGLGTDMSTVANEPAEKLLKRTGRDGWINLEECVKGNLDSLGL